MREGGLLFQSYTSALSHINKAVEIPSTQMHFKLKELERQAKEASLDGDSKVMLIARMANSGMT